MSEKIQKFILLMVGILAMSFAIVYLVFAWVEPGANPPQGNVPAPINVGDIAQTKAGRLGIGFFDPHYYLSVGTTTSGINAGLKITNPGSEPSLYVEDEPGDATPFVIDADGIIHTPYTYAPKTGDVNRDGFVNYEDLTYVAMSLGCSSGNPCWNERIGADGITNPLYKRDADVNHDGVVNLRDIIQVTANYEYFNYFTSKGFLNLPAAQFIGLSSYPNYPALVVTDDVSSPLFYVLNNGNVGIGTSTPAQKLDVVGGYVRSDTGFCIGSSCITSWPPGGGGGEAYWVLSGSNLYTSSTAWNVGIGTTSPQRKLHIHSGFPQIRTTDPSGGETWEFGSGTGGWAIYNATDGAYRLWIGNDVGIGTTTPAYKLDVNGNTRITGNLNVNGVLRVPSDEGQWGQIKLRVPAGLSYGPNESNIFRFSDPYGKYYGLYLRSGTDGLIKINDNGNVGIGTEFPEYKLDVAGDVRAGDVRMNTLRASNIMLCGKAYNCVNTNPCTYDWGDPDINFAILQVSVFFPSNDSYGRIEVGLRSNGSDIFSTYVRDHFETTPARDNFRMIFPLALSSTFDGVTVRLERWDSTNLHPITSINIAVFYPCQ